MARPPELMPELVVEILLRLPPDDLASLLRASVVCKSWRCILSDPAFVRRYRAFHREPPLLGFFHNRVSRGPVVVPRFVPGIRPSPFAEPVLDYDNWRGPVVVPRFVPSVRPSPFAEPALDYDNWRALDCRHGRVLFENFVDKGVSLVVWDPINGGRQELPVPLNRDDYVYTAALLCAVHGCDHLDCRGGPFLLVFVGWSNARNDFQLCVYSSEAGAWTAYAQCAHQDIFPFKYVAINPSALVGDVIYFIVMPRNIILRYDLGTNFLSTIYPPESHLHGGIALMPLEDGSLGLCDISGSSLFLYSRDANLLGGNIWNQIRVIELEKCITITPFSQPRVVASAGFGTIFVTTDTGIFAIELKSGRGRKVGEPENQSANYMVIFPFTSFYSLGCASSKLLLSGEAN